MAVSAHIMSSELSMLGLLTVNARSRGQQEAASQTTLPDYDPSCYLCPGNKRAQGDTNPKYDNTFVFVNDYSAVKEEQAEYHSESKDGGRPLVSYMEIARSPRPHTENN